MRDADRPAPHRLFGIDGVRALAALSILACHTWAFTAHGGGQGYWLTLFFNDLALGVTLFFTLSGFLLYRPVAAAVLRGTSQPAAGRYFRNRALRIVPAYWAILAVCGLVLGSVYVGWDGDAQVVGRMSDPGLFARSALLVQGYTPQSMFTGIGPAWSLCVEVIFYLAVPLLGLLAVRLAGARTAPGPRTLAALAPAALLLAVGLSGKLASWLLSRGPPSAGWSPTWHAVVERSFWGQADLFAFGMVLAVVWVRVQDGTLRLPSRWRRGAVAAALIVLAPCLYTLGDGQLSYLPQNTLVAFAFALLLAVVVIRPAGEPASALARGLEWRPLYAVGLVSYSLFLWHVPLIEWLTARGVLQPGLVGLAVNLAVVAALSLALSALTYWTVERPALRRKVRARAAEPAGSTQPVTVSV